MREDELRDLAKLARLELTDEDAAETRAKVDRLLAHFAMLQAVNTDGVEPSAYPLPIPLRPRPDQPAPPLPRDDVLANAPASRGGCFLVPRVVDG